MEFHFGRPKEVHYGENAVVRRKDGIHYATFETLFQSGDEPRRRRRQVASTSSLSAVVEEKPRLFDEPEPSFYSEIEEATRKVVAAYCSRLEGRYVVQVVANPVRAPANPQLDLILSGHLEPWGGDKCGVEGWVRDVNDQKLWPNVRESRQAAWVPLSQLLERHFSGGMDKSLLIVGPNGCGKSLMLMRQLHLLMNHPPQTDAPIFRLQSCHWADPNCPGLESDADEDEDEWIDDRMCWLAQNGKVVHVWDGWSESRSWASQAAAVERLMGSSSSASSASSNPNPNLAQCIITSRCVPACCLPLIRQGRMRVLQVAPLNADLWVLLGASTMESSACDLPFGQLVEAQSSSCYLTPALAACWAQCCELRLSQRKPLTQAPLPPSGSALEIVKDAFLAHYMQQMRQLQLDDDDCMSGRQEEKEAAKRKEKVWMEEGQVAWRRVGWQAWQQSGIGVVDGMTPPSSSRMSPQQSTHPHLHPCCGTYQSWFLPHEISLGMQLAAATRTIDGTSLHKCAALFHQLLQIGRAHV